MFFSVSCDFSHLFRIRRPGQCCCGFELARHLCRRLLGRRKHSGRTRRSVPRSLEMLTHHAGEQVGTVGVPRSGQGVCVCAIAIIVHRAIHAYIKQP